VVLPLSRGRLGRRSFLLSEKTRKCFLRSFARPASTGFSKATSSATFIRSGSTASRKDFFGHLPYSEKTVRSVVPKQSFLSVGCDTQRRRTRAWQTFGQCLPASRAEWHGSQLASLPLIFSGKRPCLVSVCQRRGFFRRHRSAA